MEACQVTCRSTKCALAADCQDDASWRNVRELPSGADERGCDDYEQGKPGHDYCCADEGVVASGATQLAKDACPAACRTCDTQLDDLEFFSSRDFMLAVLAAVPLLLRIVDVGWAVQGVLRCLPCCLDDGAATDTAAAGHGHSGGGRNPVAAAAGSGPGPSSSGRDESVELESSPLKLSPMDDSSSPPNGSSSSSSDSVSVSMRMSRMDIGSERLDVSTVWRVGSTSGGGGGGGGGSRHAGADAGGGGGGGGGGGSGNRLSWSEGCAVRRMGFCEALRCSAYRLVAWHLCPPLIYCWLYRSYYYSLDDEGPIFFYLAWIVGLREATHAILAIWCALSKPLVFLVDLQATLESAGVIEHLGLVIFAPWVLLLRATFPMHAQQELGRSSSGGSSSSSYAATATAAPAVPAASGGGVGRAGASGGGCCGTIGIWRQLYLRDRILLCFMAVVSVMELCSVVAFVMGIWYEDLVPYPLMVSFAVGSLSWFFLAYIAKRVLCSGPDDDDDEDDDDF